MTTIVAFAFALLALSSSALADTVAPPRPPSFKLRVTVHDGSQAHSFRVNAGHGLPCATASRKLPEQQIDLRICVPDAEHLEIHWYTRRGPSESRGSSTLPLEPGTTGTLGGERDARVEVSIQ